nr:DUF3955 domain-containing protein [Lysobacter enzymogenes]
MSRLFSLPGISLLCFVLAAACAAGYRAIGAQIDAEGFLHEPFPLIPLGYLSFFVGAVCAATAGVRALRRRRA